MSSSGEDERKSLVSSIGSEDSDIEDEDFPNNQPRKRVRLSPSDEDVPAKVQRKPIEPVLSRIKARKNGLPPNATLPSDHVSTKVTVPTEKTSFAKLNVKPWLVASLANMAITRPTAIQKESIPEILKGRDCIGGSRTGSGKTVAFAVPMLQKWAEDRERFNSSFAKFSY